MLSTGSGDLQIGRLELDPNGNLESFLNQPYGDPVTFSWGTVALAQSYGIEVGKWPWDPSAIGLSSTPKLPANCFPDPIFCTNGPFGGPTFATQGVTDGVVGTTVTLDGALAGQGRYCWMVWPILQDPADSSQPNILGQPFVNPDPGRFCYSTQAAPPKVTIDNPPPSTGFSRNTPITGNVRFPYVPDPGNFGFSGTASTQESTQASITASPECTPVTNSDPFTWQPGQNFVFKDIYDCVYSFSLFPTENTTCTLTASATGYGVEVQAEPVSFTTGSCGGVNEPCCDEGTSLIGGRCDATDMICNTTGTIPICQACGTAGILCCDPLKSAFDCTTGTTCTDESFLAPGSVPGPFISFCDKPGCGKSAGADCCHLGCASPLQCDIDTQKCTAPCTPPARPAGLRPGFVELPPECVFGSSTFLSDACVTWAAQNAPKASDGPNGVGTLGWNTEAGVTWTVTMDCVSVGLQLVSVATEASEHHSHRDHRAPPSHLTS